MNLEKELTELEDKYRDILREISRAYFKEKRKLPDEKNIVITKITLPREYIERLLEYRPFRVVWNRKPIYRYVKNKWHRIETFPNLGGIEVEEGDTVQVQVMAVRPRKRRRSVVVVVASGNKN